MRPKFVTQFQKYDFHAQLLAISISKTKIQVSILGQLSISAFQFRWHENYVLRNGRGNSDLVKVVIY